MKKINIPLDQQVVDLETARELTEKLNSVGIEMESELCWVKTIDHKNNATATKDVWSVWRGCYMAKMHKLFWDYTYTLPELLEVLPCYIEILGEIFFRAIYGNHLICYESGDTKTRLTNQKGKIDDKTSPATAAAKLLIWCIDNGYINGGGE